MAGNLGRARVRASVAVAIAVALSVLALPSPADAAGALDPTFGGDGTVVTDLGGEEKAFAVAIQADGGIVTVVSDYAGGFAVARYLPDGSLDPGFGGDGVVTTDFGGSGAARAVAVQPDGRIVAAGSAITSTGSDFAVARYLADGSLDTTFGGDGLVTTDFGGEGLAQSDAAAAIAIQPDGRILTAGSGGGVPRAPDFVLARYRPDGSLDPTFGDLGLVTTDLGGTDDAVKALALQDDGKIVAAGAQRNLSRGEGVFALARYEPDGILDGSFGSDGIVIIRAPNSDSNFADDVAIGADGRIVATGPDRGRAPAGGLRAGFAVVRLLSDGSPDPTFGSGGWVQTDVIGGDARADALAVQADGRIVVAGTGASGFAVVRYLPDGLLDPSFGEGGQVITDFGDEEIVFDLTLDGSGRIVTVGSSGDNVALARYLTVDVATCFSRTPTVVGTPGNDTITGTPGDDVIAGLGGDDTLVGGAGDDVVCGGDGDDVVVGGLGNDTLLGDDGDDFVDGGVVGFDPAQIGIDDDDLFGGEGADILWSADFGRVDINGGDGDDRLFGGPHSDRLEGGPGNDTVEGRTGKDLLDGGVVGPDPFQSTFDDDRLFGGPGADVLWSADFGRVDAYGGQGDDVLHGLDGDDMLTGGAGQDRVIAGAGRDQINIVDRGPDKANGQAGLDTCNADPQDTVVNCP